MTETVLTSWLLMLVQVPSEPSRHRVAVWRELRRFGAVPVGQSAWTAPDVPSCREGAGTARDLARAGNGELILLTANSAKDVFATPAAALADQELTACAAALEEFSGYVYRELHS